MKITMERRRRANAVSSTAGREASRGPEGCGEPPRRVCFYDNRRKRLRTRAAWPWVTSTVVPQRRLSEQE